MALSSWTTWYIFTASWSTGFQCFHNNFVPSNCSGSSDTSTYLPRITPSLHPALCIRNHIVKEQVSFLGLEKQEKGAQYFSCAHYTDTAHVKNTWKVITVADPWSIYQVQLHLKHMKVYLNSCIVPSYGADCNLGWLKISGIRSNLQVTLSLCWLLTALLPGRQRSSWIHYSISSWWSRYTVAVTEPWMHGALNLGVLAWSLLKLVILWRWLPILIHSIHQLLQHSISLYVALYHISNKHSQLWQVSWHMAACKSTIICLCPRVTTLKQIRYKYAICVPTKSKTLKF